MANGESEFFKNAAREASREAGLEPAPDGLVDIVRMGAQETLQAYAATMGDMMRERGEFVTLANLLICLIHETARSMQGLDKQSTAAFLSAYGAAMAADDLADDDPVKLEAARELNRRQIALIHLEQSRFSEKS